jgi:hypothetical protein
VLAASVLPGLLALPVVVRAEEPKPASQVDLELRQSEASAFTRPKPTVVPPEMSEQVIREADQAVDEFEARQISPEVKRELERGAGIPPSRRPDLDRDVTEGIQQQNIERALRRR